MGEGIGLLFVCGEFFFPPGSVLPWASLLNLFKLTAKIVFIVKFELVGDFFYIQLGMFEQKAGSIDFKPQKILDWCDIVFILKHPD